MKPVLAIRHAPQESLGLLAEVFQQAHLSYGYIDMFDQPPRSIDPSQLSGLVILGGPMNVDQTEEYSYIPNEILWIQQALEVKLPLLGVCFGSQMLAKALGADVYKSPVKEIGWFEVMLTDEAAEDPLFEQCQIQQTVFQWHGDTFDLPVGATHLVVAEECPHQAFSYQRHAYGLQFHAELTSEMIDAWLAEPGMAKELAAYDPQGAQEIRRRVAAELPKMRAFGEKVFERFASLCHRWSLKN